MSATWQELRDYLIALAESYEFDLARYENPMTQVALPNLEDFLAVAAQGIASWWNDWNVGHGGGIDADKLDGHHWSEFPTAATFEFNEQPSGLINGVNTIFTTAYDFKGGTTQVYLNGLRQILGASESYTETDSDEITMSEAPKAGDKLRLDYLKL